MPTLNEYYSGLESRDSFVREAADPAYPGPFNNGEIPDQNDFSHVFGTFLSRRDDGLFKRIDTPLCIQAATGATNPNAVLHIFADNVSDPEWQFRLGDDEGVGNLVITSFNDQQLTIDVNTRISENRVLDVRGEISIGGYIDFEPIPPFPEPIQPLLQVHRFGAGYEWPLDNNAAGILGHVGMWNTIANDENTFKQGMAINVIGNEGIRTGMGINLTGNRGQSTGININVSGENNDGFIGLNARVEGSGSGPIYGIQSEVRSTEARWKYGVAGRATAASGTTSYGIYGSVANTASGGTNWAGFFVGDVNVAGNLNASSITKPAGSFLIDHPLDPENKTLRHNFVESPENLCIYRGIIKIGASGKKLVKLPDYFAALTKEEEASIILSSIGPKPSLTSYKWKEDFESFYVFADPGTEVSYLVLADRDDPVIRLLKKPVEEEKGNGNFEKGKYLSPEAYNKDKSLGVFSAPEELSFEEKSDEKQ